MKKQTSIHYLIIIKVDFNTVFFETWLESTYDAISLIEMITDSSMFRSHVSSLTDCTIELIQEKSSEFSEILNELRFDGRSFEFQIEDMFK